MFLTFHGEHRGDHHTWTMSTRARRSMLMPLDVLAAGAVLSGCRRLWLVRRRGLGGTSGAQSIVSRRPSTILHDMHEVPLLGEAAAAGRGGRRPRRSAYYYYIVDPGLPARTVADLQAALHAVLQQVVLRRALRLRCSSSRRWRSAAASGEGDGAIIDGLGPDGIAARARWTSPGALSRLPDRLPLPLCLRHADRRRGARQLVLHAVREVGRMASWPLLSLVTFLPLVGARVLPGRAAATQGGRRPQQPQRRADGRRW